MNIEQPKRTNKPSSTLTMTQEITEAGQRALTPPQSVSGTSGVQGSSPSSDGFSDFQADAHPHGVPQDNIITFEYGEGFQSKRSISEELLYRHSNTFPSYCGDAKKMRQKYKDCEEIKEKLAHLSTLVTSKKYEEEGVEDKIIKLLERIRDHYPLGNYQNRLKDVLEATVEDQFTLKNTRSTCKLKASSKEYRDMVLMSRLRLLNHKGMLVVCDRLIGAFTRIEASERVKAEKQPVIAIAQGRVLLPGVDEQSVQSFVAWLEHDRLHCETDKQLYALYKLAVKLGVDTLTDQCVIQLFEKTSEILRCAYAQGSSLQSILGYGEPEGRAQTLNQYTPPDSAIRVIFERVLNTDQPPHRLVKIVSTILAQYMDLELWLHLKLTVKHQFALHIIAEMAARREVKVESDTYDGGHIKREIHEGGTKAQPALAEAQEQPIATD